MDKKPPVTVNLSHSKPIEGPPALTELKPPHQGDGYTTATPNGAANGADHGQQDATPPILAAALALVKEMGWEVFPIRPTSRASYATKDDNGRRWGASRDPGVVRDYWTRWPNAGIGLPTGADNGFFVVDADTPAGHNVDGLASIKALEAEHGAFPQTLMAVSPSGSVHRYFKTPIGLEIRNSTSKLA